MRRVTVLLAAGAVVGGLTVAPVAPAAAARDEVIRDEATGRGSCPSPESQFTPESLTIPRVVGSTRVLALGRDRHGVPMPPPLTDRGKWQFAWDKSSRIRPGSRQGVVRLTAHTYPRDGSYGLALGNRLLTKLRVGAKLVVAGRHGQRLCYRVTKRLSVRAEESAPAYYNSGGPPLLAILVCSGVRRGPGDWSHRTIWFAEPIPDSGTG